MGIEKPHSRVKLVIPVLYSDETVYNRVLSVLTGEFGETDFQSESIGFNFTNYYDDEMEGKIYRIFLSFRNLIEVEELANIKIRTNGIEREYSSGGKRKVNLDPGYLELGKFVLATTKDQQHRLYIRDGIYEEITLFYRVKAWRHWEWTYPDYRSDIYKTILEQIREIYSGQLKNDKLKQS